MDACNARLRMVRNGFDSLTVNCPCIFKLGSENSHASVILYLVDISWAKYRIELVYGFIKRPIACKFARVGGWTLKDSRNRLGLRLRFFLLSTTCTLPSFPVLSFFSRGFRNKLYSPTSETDVAGLPQVFGLKSSVISASSQEKSSSIFDVDMTKLEIGLFLLT